MSNIRAISKYDGYCYFCFVHMFPDHELTRSYKTKEKVVVDFIKNEFPDIDFICDKQIYDGCSKKRPDMFADFGDWVLIIEVDENEHTGYTCENKRLMQLSQDIDHRPLTIIRFNPDKYTKDDVKIGSCWRNGKNGTVLVKTKTDEWTERLERLKRRIQKTIDNPSDQTIKLYNLFFSK
jgi:glutathione peroxidase-family protein